VIIPVYRGDKMPVVPRDATSVILFRDALYQDNIEILMVRRHARSQFAGDMHVFPGGGVEETDCERGVAELCTGLGPDDALSIIKEAPTPERALGFFVAGIRETFEEAGILLAQESSGELVSFKGKREAGFADYRKEMRDNQLSFNEMIAREGLKLAVDRLIYFAHWITPEIMPIRFDTRFFLTPAPPHQKASHDNVEATDHLWIIPQEALERNKSGTFSMLPPTMFNLMTLSRFSSVEEALASAEIKNVEVISPQISFEDGGMRLLLPEDPDYQ
jgi:8-oxo-dGTP pyrophosphatase MutT (NUDIX family)